MPYSSDTYQTSRTHRGSADPTANPLSELIARAISGDPSAQSRLLANQLPRWQQRLTYYKGVNPTDAEDLSVTIALKVYLSFPKITNPFAFGQFGNTVLFHTHQDFLRTRPAVRVVSLSSLFTDDGTEADEFADCLSDRDADPWRSVERAETRRLVHEAIAELPSDHQTAVRRHYLNDEALPEIARAEGWHLSKTKRLVAEARKKLEGILRGRLVLA